MLYSVVMTGMALKNRGRCIGIYPTSKTTCDGLMAITA
jgi:hypothetical protein